MFFDSKCLYILILYGHCLGLVLRLATDVLLPSLDATTLHNLYMYNMKYATTKRNWTLYLYDDKQQNRLIFVVMFNASRQMPCHSASVLGSQLISTLQLLKMLLD